MLRATTPDLGIADAAGEATPDCLRAAARTYRRAFSTAASRLAEVTAVHQQFSDIVFAAARRFDHAGAAPAGSPEADVAGSAGTCAMRTERPS